ncbi:hypothetical protein ACQKOE_07360 [Novosphingobium sp. NPDC080210]|uniref:hypothetical protein n=1 Tax=Novosphingobium sp. NPDC080210 TaxID=3390596 RepID=UPI003D0471B4
MATRSRIGIKRTDGSLELIYCHSDGYFAHNGRMLHEHWQSQAKVEGMIARGDMSVLGEVVGKKHDFNWVMNFPETAEGHIDWDGVRADPRHKMCLFYMRDRGDKELYSQRFSNLEAAAEIFEEYLYLWDETRDAWIGCQTPWQCNPASLDWYLLSDLAEIKFYDEDIHKVPTTTYHSAASQIIDATPTVMDKMVEGLHQF